MQECAQDAAGFGGITPLPRQPHQSTLGGLGSLERYSHIPSSVGSVWSQTDVNSLACSS